MSVSSNNCYRRAVNQAIDYIIESFRWESKLALRQQLCWYMVCTSCKQICLTEAELYKYSDVTYDLCKVYKQYCLDHNLIAEKYALSEELPENVKNVPQVEEYFQWIFKLQKWAASWKRKVDCETLTYHEICSLKSKFTQFQLLVEATCLPFAVVKQSTLEKAYDDFGSLFDLLNCHLIKYIPGYPGLKW